MSQIHADEADHEAIEQFSGDLRAKLRLLELCNAIHGRRAAARLWEKFKMPRIDNAASLGGGGVLGVGSITDEFLEDQCEFSTGARIQSSVLYDRFSVWCGERGVAVMSAKAFTMAVDERGIRRLKSRVVWFLDIRLKTDN